MRNKFYTILLAIIASVGTLLAENGSCGAHLTWDFTNGVLTISGTGAMDDYSYTSSPPWSRKLSSIKSAIVNDGVTSIGNWAFKDCSQLTSVTLPNSVTSIGESAFENCSRLPSIEIPNSVTSIGDEAFYRCISLTLPIYNTHIFACLPYNYSGAYTIPEGIESIAGHAFYDCSGLTSVTIPNSVTDIRVWAFHGCTGLTSIDIPNSVISIENSAFYGCTGLTSIKISNSITSIVTRVFCNCSSLTSVTIPNSVTSIGEGAFERCSSLTAVTIPNSVTSIGGSAFYECTSLTSIEIPGSITSIGTYAFRDCTCSYIICNANTPPSLGGNTFKTTYNCPIYVPCGTLDSYKTANGWDNYATRLRYQSLPYTFTVTCDATEGKVTAPSNPLVCDNPFSITATPNYGYHFTQWSDENTDNPRTIEVTKDTILTAEFAVDVSGVCGDDLALKWEYDNKSNTLIISGNGSLCSNYTYGVEAPKNMLKLVIAEGVTAVGNKAFSDCNSLLSVEIPNSVTNIAAEAFYNCNSLTSVTLKSTTIVSKNYTSSISINNIFGSQVTKYILPNNIESIGESAFWGCFGLTSIEIPNSVTTIGNMAFGSCTSLTSIDIPNNVTSIGDYAFYICTGLTSVTIGNSVTNIGNMAFQGCSSLTSVTLKSDAIVSKNYTSSSSLKNIFGSQVTEYIIGNNVTSIGEYAFSGCAKLTSLTILNSITSIGNYAFSGCSGLTSLEIPNSVTSIGDYAFYSCSGLTSVTIPNSVTNIGDYAFCSCWSLTSVTIPNSVVSIGNAAFSSCSGLTSMTIPNSVTSIGDYAFSGCSGLTSISIGNSVASIGGNAFYSCPSLTSVIWNAKNCNGYNFGAKVESITFGDEVEVIPASLCSGMYKLTSVTIPNSVTSIGNSAFYVCSGLTSMTIPNSVTSIGDYAFSGCSGLTSISIGNSVASIGNMAFGNCTGLTSVTLNSNAIVSKNYTSSSSLTSIFGSQVTEYIIGNSITSIGEYAFASCSNLTSIEIPNNVTSIGNHVFHGCTGLTSVSIPNSVTRIGGSAFSGCSSLISVTIPNSITNIGVQTFYNCTGLTSVTIPNSVTYIGDYAFNGCSSLASVTIPCSIKHIGTNAFSKNTTIIKDCGITKNTEVNLSLCEGEKLSWNNKTIASVKPSDSGDYEYKTKTVLYDDSIVTLHLTVNPKYNITLEDTTLCYSEDLYIGGVKCPLSKKANTKQTWTRNLQTKESCDSIVSISVTWRKLSDFTITTKDEFDTPSSGSISYKKTDTNYSGKFYYTLNGKKNASLSYLSAGTYRLVFHSDDNCGDSIVKTVQIYKYGMKVNGLYYLLNEENHTATLTYRGASYDSYSGEYSGNITIPPTITFNGEEYQVTGIKGSTFSGCNSINSITMKSETPISISSIGLSSSCIIYVPYGSLSAYKANPYWSYYNLHVTNPSHATSTSGPTSTNITFGNAEEQKHIVSCGIEDGVIFDGYTLDYIGLEPESEYKAVPFIIKTKEGDQDVMYCSFTTTALSLTTQPSKPVSSTTAILLAETNMADIETSCGFEWKRNDAPDDMAPNKVVCPVASGTMAGRLKNLKDDVYYKYRAFYESAAGNMYYGDWQYIFTGDVAVEFDPILYTYAAVAVKENEATLKGYALAGSTDFTEQGFEYWAENRSGASGILARRAASIGEHHTITASGISMKTTLTNLDAGTVYRYRTYAKIGDQTLYGTEMTFITQGEFAPPTYVITFVNWDGAELQSSPVAENTMPEYMGETPVRPEDEQYTYTFNGWSPAIVIATADATYTATYKAESKAQAVDQVQTDNTVTKILRNGHIYILRGEHVYDAQGKRVR